MEKLQILNAAQYRDRILTRLQKDMRNCKNYLQECRKHITEAHRHNDEDTAIFWAEQYDIAAQNLQALRVQMRGI